MPAELVGFVRALHVAATLSLFGSLVFRAAIAPAAFARAPRDAVSPVERRLDRLAFFSLAVAVAASVPWLLLEAASMSGAGSVAETLAAVWPALLDTRFGRVLLVRIGLLLAAGLCLLPRGAWRRWTLPAGAALAGASAALVAAIGHAAAMEGADQTVLLIMQGLHLVAAGAWLGALAPLLLTLALPPAASAVAAERFSPLGIACVAALAVSAWFLGQGLIGGIPALVGTPYGRWALLKLALFAALLVLAARHRFRLTPALKADRGGSATRHAFRRSVAVETAVGLLVVLAAGQLASTTPGIHGQPWWPFPVRFSAEALQDPDLYREVLVASFGVLVGAVLVGAGLGGARWRRLAIVPGLALVAWSAPSLRLLTQEAYPTSFWRSPTGFSSASVVEGAAVFAENCAACHGPGGNGDGPAAKGLRVPPADLTAEHLWGHSDGDLFWWISHGIDDAMPGFGKTLDETAIWNAIDFVHANAAGALARRGGAFERPIPAPGFDARCPDGRTVRLRDLRGQVVLVVAGTSGAAERARAAGVRTVLLAERADGPTGEYCVASRPAAWQAYAILSGRAPEGLAGGEFLIDPAGRLRMEWFPGETPDWRDPAVLLARVREIRAKPLAGPMVPIAHMHVH